MEHVGTVFLYFRISTQAIYAKQGDIIINGRGSIFGYDIVIDVSRPHTHTGEGHPKPTALQTCARAKYAKHHRWYQALGLGFRV